MSRVSPAQRFTADHPCPVCGGHDGLPRGESVRCAGFRSDDGRWAHCTREEHAGQLRQHVASATYAHRLDIPCRCGRAHDAAPGPRPGRPVSNGHAPGVLVATYDYRALDGRVVHRTCRHEPKEFRQCRPDPDRPGAWIHNLAGVDLVIYRLSEIQGQADVVVVEGEKDADALAALGVAATCNAMGAGKWRTGYTQQLVAAGVRRVAVLPDNDPPGQEHAAAIAASCAAAGLVARVVSLPGLPAARAKDGEDVSDWLEQGHTVEELRALLAAAWAEPARGPATGTAEPRTPPASPPAPTLATEAFYGLAGRVVECIEPTSEADPAAILLHVLIGVGNLIGRSVYATVEKTRHCCNEFVVLVGDSAKGRKGQAWSTPRALLDAVNPEWAAARVRSGLSTGEGLIYHVRDAREEQQPVKDHGRVVDYQRVVVDPGEADKRLLLFEPEFASVLRRMNGETSSLSAVLREGWESGDLATLTRREALRATGAHISVIAHVTREELIANLTETERANGFANRFLFCLVRRSKFLPDGGGVSDAALAPLIADLRAIAAYATAAPRELRRTPEAAEMWRAIYRALSAGEPGLLGAVLARAEAHVLRLSLLYAALDCAPAVTPDHLKAAVALWDYAEASARRIFGGRSGIADEDALVAALRARGPLTQTEISSLFHRNKTAEQLGGPAALGRGRRPNSEGHSPSGRGPRRATGDPLGGGAMTRAGVISLIRLFRTGALHA